MKNNPNILHLTILIIGLIMTTALTGCKDDDDPKPIETGKISDIDGNIYETVTIGDQVWMKENLKTTRYADGSNIDYPGADTAAWRTNTTGAYAWHNNDEGNKNTYGALYNWYAVNNSQGLCPVGWRVSTSEDWTKMSNYLREEHDLSNDETDPNALGNKLKSCRMLNSPLGGECATVVHPRWNYHEINVGTNDFEFSALPGGDRIPTGEYSSQGSFGFWWNSTEIDANTANRRYINFDQSRLYGNSFPKNYGLSVRCVKN